jgi:hypothetical protein
MNKLIRIFRHLLHELVLFMVPKSIRKNMLSCEEVSRILADEEGHNSASVFKLKMHLFICQCCTDYSKQLNVIDERSRALSKVSLSDEQKSMIKKSQEKAINSLKDSK